MLVPVVQLCRFSCPQDGSSAQVPAAGDFSRHQPLQLDRLCPVGTAARVLQLSRLVQVGRRACVDGTGGEVMVLLLLLLLGGVVCC